MQAGKSCADFDFGQAPALWNFSFAPLDEEAFVRNILEAIAEWTALCCVSVWERQRVGKQLLKTLAFKSPTPG